MVQLSHVQSEGLADLLRELADGCTPDTLRELADEVPTAADFIDPMHIRDTDAEGLPRRQGRALTRCSARSNRHDRKQRHHGQ